MIGAILLYQSPLVGRRIRGTFSNINNTSHNIKISSATASRRIAYEEEIKLILQKPILGYGLGKADLTLKESLISSGYVALGQKMHTHSQYFNTWLQLGIIGILWLVSMLLFLASYFLKNKAQIAFWFTILVAINLMTDDMLEIQAGIVFFVLILSLYFTRILRTTNQ